MPKEISMFKEINSANVASFWTTKQQQEAPYLGEILFPSTKQSERSIEFYKGMTRAPKPLRPAAYGTQAIPRDRQGLEKVTTHTNFFKESDYMDENITAELADLAASNDQTRYQLVLSRVFNDSAELIRGAALTREILRMQTLLAGKYGITGNGVNVHDDFNMSAKHQGLAKAAGWNVDGSDPVYDIQNAIDIIGADQGVTVNRLYMNTHTFRALLANIQIKSTLLANNANTPAVALPRNVLKSYLLDEFGVNITLYDKNYQTAAGLQYFIPDGKIVFAPEGDLGRTVFSPTPEERGIRLGNTVDLSYVDTGVAVTMTQINDPVTVETKVTQEFAPTFERIDDVFVLDAFKAAEPTTVVNGGTGETTPAKA